MKLAVAEGRPVLHPASTEVLPHGGQPRFFGTIYSCVQAALTEAELKSVRTVSTSGDAFRTHDHIVKLRSFLGWGLTSFE